MNSVDTENKLDARIPCEKFQTRGRRSLMRQIPASPFLDL